MLGIFKIENLQILFSDILDNKKMISIEDANKLLHKEINDPKRIEHSVAVAKIMESLAHQFKVNIDKWYLTGLLHDIDLPETINKLQMHGIIAKEKLTGLLPLQSIDAIMAHDYRTGIIAKTKIAKALIFADVFDNMQSNIGLKSIIECRKKNEWNKLKEHLPNKEYHLYVLQEYFDQWPKIRI